MLNPCYHCGSPVPSGISISTEILGEARNMCCIGCEAVANAIVASGSEQFYEFRTQESETPEFTPQALPETVQNELTLYDNEDVLNDITRKVDDHQREITLVIEGITCAACSWLIEKQLARFKGVTSANLNLSQHRLTLRWNQQSSPISQLIERIYSLGFKAFPYSANTAQSHLEAEQRLAIRRLVLAGFGSMQAMMFAIPLYIGDWAGVFEQFQVFIRYASLVITTPVVIYSAKPFFQAFVRDIRSRHLTMDVPVAIAIGTAYIASIWSTIVGGPDTYFDSVCMFTFFLLLGRYLETKARVRTGDAGNNLASLVPSSALKIIDGNEAVIPAKQLKVDDIVRINPGTHIPVDGKVIKGCSGVDESAFTGEFVPVSKQVGDQVIGGTLNVESPLEVQVTAVGHETQASTVLQLLDRAQEEKPAIAQLADNVAQYFVACVLLISTLVFVIWMFIDSQQAFWITLSVLVVTCPCALSLATPTALTSATGTLRKQGILITRSHVLEGLTKSRRIIFDKTGTLTTGQLTITEHISYVEKELAMSLATGLEQHSKHPIANAFTSQDPIQFDDIQVVPGLGVSGQWQGDTYRIGQPNFASEDNCQTPPDNNHWVLLTKNQKPLAWYKLHDQLRNDAANAIQQLKDLAFTTELLSGDRSNHVESTANALALDKATGGASPENKLTHIENVETKDYTIMVGDGINDVPVIAQAPISVAVGNASDLAKTHADIILVSNQLSRLPQMIRHAHKTKRIIQQNLTWALIYNGTALPLAAFGLVPPYVAAIGMSLSSLVVVGNALRLNRIK